MVVPPEHEDHVDDTALVGREDGVRAGPGGQVYQGVGGEPVQQVEGVLAGAAETAEWALDEGDALRQGVVLPEMVVGCQEPPFRTPKEVPQPQLGPRVRVVEDEALAVEAAGVLQRCAGKEDVGLAIDPELQAVLLDYLVVLGELR